MLYNYKYVPNKVFPWLKGGESQRNFQNIFFIGSKQQYLKPNTAVWTYLCRLFLLRPFTSLPQKSLHPVYLLILAYELVFFKSI